MLKLKRLQLVVVILIVIFSFMPAHSCVVACRESFETAKGLRIHQQRCQVFLYTDPSLQNLQTRLKTQQERFSKEDTLNADENRSDDVGIFWLCRTFLLTNQVVSLLRLASQKLLIHPYRTFQRSHRPLNQMLALPNHLSPCRLRAHDRHERRDQLGRF